MPSIETLNESVSREELDEDNPTFYESTINKSYQKTINEFDLLK